MNLNAFLYFDNDEQEWIEIESKTNGFEGFPPFHNTHFSNTFYKKGSTF